MDSITRWALCSVLGAASFASAHLGRQLQARFAGSQGRQESRAKRAAEACRKERCAATPWAAAVCLCLPTAAACGQDLFSRLSHGYHCAFNRGTDWRCAQHRAAAAEPR